MFVEQLRQDKKIVVVHDSVDAMPERCKLVFHRVDDGANFAATTHREALEIDKKYVLLRVVGEALIEGNAQQMVAQAHGLGAEDTRIHQLGFIANDRLEVHLRENVPLDIDAGCDLTQLQTVGRQDEHAAFRNV